MYLVVGLMKSNEDGEHCNVKCSQPRNVNNLNYIILSSSLYIFPCSKSFELKTPNKLNSMEQSPQHIRLTRVTCQFLKIKPIGCRKAARDVGGELTRNMTV